MTIKGCERLCSAATEIIQIRWVGFYYCFAYVHAIGLLRFAQMDSMHVGGMSSDVQLSLQLLVVGVGCLVGPIAFMAVIPTTVTSMTLAVGGCFVLFAASTFVSLL